MANGIIVHWTEEEVSLLGVWADAEIAKAYHRTLAAVRKKRREIGRARCHLLHRPWREYEIAILGKLVDADAARLLGRSRSSVKSRRRRLGIPCVDAIFRWTSGRDGCLGLLSDESLSVAFGISPLAVKARRNRLRIPDTSNQSLSRICLDCGACFTASRACSTESLCRCCKKKIRYERHRRWAANNPEYISEYMNRWKQRVADAERSRQQIVRSFAIQEMIDNA